GGDLLGQVVDGRAEAAVDDDRIGALAGELEGAEQALAVVADGGLPAHGEADVLELLAHVAEVGVDDLAGQHLVARADDLDAHAHRSSPGANDASRWRRPAPPTLGDEARPGPRAIRGRGESIIHRPRCTLGRPGGRRVARARRKGWDSRATR